jgi:hypothetical protein
MLVQDPQANLAERETLKYIAEMAIHLTHSTYLTHLPHPTHLQIVLILRNMAETVRNLT